MRKIAAYVFAVSLLSVAVSGCGKVEENLQAGTPDDISEAVITAEVTGDEPAEEFDEDETDDEEETAETTAVTTVTEPKVTTAAETTAAKVNVSEENDEDEYEEDDDTPPAVRTTQKPKETEKPVPKETDPPAPKETEPPAPVYNEPEEEIEPTYINGILIVNKTYALPESYAPGGLTSDTWAAFNRMNEDAAAEGLNLVLGSGFRSYELQADLYNRYSARDGAAAADRYSARPGHSEHQTGLAFDLAPIDSSFENTPECPWVAANCYKYGFIVRYPKGKESVTGYMYEPWHLRYIGVDLATDVYNSGLCLEEYLGITSQYAD